MVENILAARPWGDHQERNVVTTAQPPLVGRLQRALLAPLLLRDMQPEMMAVRTTLEAGLAGGEEEIVIDHRGDPADDGEDVRLGEDHYSYRWKRARWEGHTQDEEHALMQLRGSPRKPPATRRRDQRSFDTRGAMARLASRLRSETELMAPRHAARAPWFIQRIVYYMERRQRCLTAAEWQSAAQGL